MQVCNDFLNGRCHRANCRYKHMPRPDGTMPEQVAPPTAPQFIAPPDLDESLYDRTTGFGLYGTPTYGTRFGSGPLPIIRAEDTRPMCIEFFNTGRCTRRGPHGQTCMYRHVAKDDPLKIDQNKPQGAAASLEVKRKLPPGWVSESSKKHPVVKNPKADPEELRARADAWAEKALATKAARAKAAEEAAKAAEAAANAPAAAPAAAAPASDPSSEAARAEYERKYAAWLAQYQAYMAQQGAGYGGQPGGGYPPYGGAPPPHAVQQ